MRVMKRRLLSVAGAVLLASPASATTLKQMNLADLAGRADKDLPGHGPVGEAGHREGGRGRAADRRLPPAGGRGVQGRLRRGRGEGPRRDPDGGRAQGARARRDCGTSRSVARRAAPGEGPAVRAVHDAAEPRSASPRRSGWARAPSASSARERTEKAVNAVGNVGLSRGMPGTIRRAARGRCPTPQLARAIHAVLGE